MFLYMIKVKLELPSYEFTLLDIFGYMQKLLIKKNKSYLYGIWYPMS